MTHVLFIPVKDELPLVLTVYDGACGSGGMLTESQDFIADEDGPIAAKSAVYLYGKLGQRRDRPMGDCCS